MYLDSSPTKSPWGEIQACYGVCSGVYSVSTASHGGIMAEETAAKSIFSKAALRCAFHSMGFYCFEEDCDAPVALRELMDKKLYDAPVNEYYREGEFSDCIDRSLQNWHPEYWKARQKR